MFIYPDYKLYYILPFLPHDSTVCFENRGTADPQISLLRGLRLQLLIIGCLRCLGRYEGEMDGLLVDIYIYGQMDDWKMIGKKKTHLDFVDTVYGCLC
jgi:hypothetical protein